jgi:hypothetical protein
MLSYTPVNSTTALRWSLIFCASMPLFLLAFMLVAWLRQGGSFGMVVSGIDWISYAGWSVFIGLSVTALAIYQTRRDNQLWKGFFDLRNVQALLQEGFELDRHGLHGYVNQIPVSLHFQKETLGDFAKVVVFAEVSDDVEVLKSLGAKHGENWFFMFSEYEHLIDPPFDHVDFQEMIDEALKMGEKEEFRFASKHPVIH